MQKLKLLIWLLFFWILFFFNKHNRQMNTMVWQGSGILAPWDDIKWRKRKVILHKSCPIGNGGSTPPIIAKHCGVEQLVARQAQDRVTHCEEFTELTFWVSHSFNYEMSSTLIFSTNLEVVGSSPTPATKKNTKYFHKYLDISNFFVIFVLLSSLISIVKNIRVGFSSFLYPSGERRKITSEYISWESQ